MSNDKTRVVVTGINWMGSGIGSIESAVDQLFREARDEIVLTVYSISVQGDLIFEWLEIALNRGVETKMIVNRISEQSTDAVNAAERSGQEVPTLSAL